MNILAEFEKRYNGDPSETEAICTAIAIENGLDIEETMNFVYIHRYEETETFETIPGEEE